MRPTLLLALPILMVISACTPDRSLTTGSPHWPGEYRGGYNDDYDDSAMPPPQSEDDDLNR